MISPADEAMATRLARKLSELQVADFEADTVRAADTDLLPYGLKTPARQFIISWAPSVTATNPPTTLDFGTNTTGQVFARRIGEDSVYGIALADYDELPSASWQMRDRQIWNFEVKDVARLTFQQNGQTIEIVHRTNDWKLAAGTNWILNDSAVEDTMRDLSHLKAFSWICHGADKPAGFDIDAKAYQLTVELKNGQKLAFQFGRETPLGSPYASVLLNGEPWIFQFPPDIFPSLQFSLMLHSP